MSYNETVDDLNRKYARSFILHKGKPVLIEGFKLNDDDDVMYAVFMGKGDKVWNVGDWDAGEFSELHIPNGFYNIAKPGTPSAYIYHRVPRRQYRRGICEDNSSLSAILNYVSSALGVWAGTVALEDFDTITALMEKRYPDSLEEALHAVDTSGSVAICPEFALTMHVSKPDGILIVNRNNHFIGEVVNGEMKIHFQPMLQEVKDTVYRRQLNTKVSLA